MHAKRYLIWPVVHQVAPVYPDWEQCIGNVLPPMTPHTGCSYRCYLRLLSSLSLVRSCVFVQVICYPDARHEIFNETNRDEVILALELRTDVIINILRMLLMMPALWQVARDLVLWLEDTLSGRFPMLPSKL